MMSPISWGICRSSPLLLLLLLLTMVSLSCAAEFKFDARYYMYTGWSGYRRIAPYRISPENKKLAIYNRIYSESRLGYFYHYHQAYFYHSRIQYYTIQIKRKYSFECSNFEANNQSDYLGYFFCPLRFEPRNHSACCGDDKYQYCCYEKEDALDWWLENWWKLRIGLGVAIPLLVILISVCGGACIWCCKRHSRTRRPGNTLPPSVVFTPSADTTDPSAPPPYAVCSPSTWQDTGTGECPYPRQPGFTAVERS